MTVPARRGQVDASGERPVTGVVWGAALLGIAATAYGAASYPEALAPLWGRASWNWVAVLLVLAVLVVAAQRRTRRPALVAGVVGGGAVLGAFGIGAACSVALIIASAFAFGSWLLDRAGADGAHPSPPVAATAIGVAAQTLFLGVTAHFPINTAPAYLAVAVAALWLGRRHVADHARRTVAVAQARWHGATAPFVVAAALWFALGIQMYYAALPERYHDALALHLVIPRALELSGRWNFDAAENVWAVAPLGADFLFGWAYVLAGEPAAKLLNFALLLLTCGLVVETKFASRTASLAAVAAFLLMPLTVIETASLFVENALTLFLAAAVAFAGGLPGSRGQRLVGLAFAMGGAVAVKLHGLVALGALGLALAVAGTWRAALPAPRRAWLLSLVPVVLGAKTYIYAWIVTGNPIFPLYNAIFKSSLFPVENFSNSLYPGESRSSISTTSRFGPRSISRPGTGRWAFSWPCCSRQGW